MTQQKIKNGFNRLSDVNFKTKVQYIITSMTNNAHFVNPVPALNEVQAALHEFEEALLASKTGDKITILLREEKRTILTELLHRLGNYVVYVAAGDKVILSESGFDLGREKQYGNRVEAPTNVQVTTDHLNAGETKIKFTAVPYARMYVYQYTTDEALSETSWASRYHTQCKMLIKGLESGKRYWFRVSAIGSSGHVMTSQVVSRVIQ